jgi:hypothetical protein
MWTVILNNRRRLSFETADAMQTHLYNNERFCDVDKSLAFHRQAGKMTVKYRLHFGNHTHNGCMFEELN